MERRIVYIVLLIVFLTVSVIFIDPPITYNSNAKSFHSSSLIKSIERTDKKEIITYMDSNGIVTFATDLGYAIKTITYIQSGIIEEFFDENGNPIYRSPGYCAIFYEYDEQGRKKRMTYLGDNRKPINITYGYATIEYLFDENNRNEYEFFYNKDGKHIYSYQYGYGRKFEYYEDGRIKRITFLDEDYTPMKTGLGYVSLIRTYYCSDGAENGKVEYEFYFDAKGNPIAINLGQYGVHKEYNEFGQCNIETYLNADGNPIVTSKGYSMVVRTFYGDNSISSELYYDINGKPINLSEGQYGKKIENGEEKYLNSDGTVKFNLKRLLYNKSYLAIVLAFFLVVFSAKVSKKANIIILLLYFAVIVYITLLFRDNKKAEINWEIFRSYKEALSNPIALSSIIRNIWLFIPIGAVLYKIYPHKIILFIPIILSILIETIQLLAEIGYCEINDVISNSLGSIIGYVTGKIFGRVS